MKNSFFQVENYHTHAKKVTFFKRKVQTSKLRQKLMPSFASVLRSISRRVVLSRRLVLSELAVSVLVAEPQFTGGSCSLVYSDNFNVGGSLQISFSSWISWWYLTSYLYGLTFPLDSNVAMPSRRILVRIGRLRILSHFLSMALRSSDRQRLWVVSGHRRMWSRSSSIWLPYGI